MTTGATDAGAVYVYKRTTTGSGNNLTESWDSDTSTSSTIDPEIKITKTNFSDLAAGDLFGSSISLNKAGDKLAIGAPGDG